MLEFCVEACKVNCYPRAPHLFVFGKYRTNNDTNIYHYFPSKYRSGLVNNHE